MKWMIQLLAVPAIAILAAMPQAYAQAPTLPILSAAEKDFVEEMIEDNNWEIAWLQLGMSAGTDAELKTHAEHMLADHRNMDVALRAYAAKYGIGLEGTAADKVKINEKPGREWDGDWADEMADEHRKMVQNFERALTFAQEPELRDLINNTLPSIRTHLDMATQLRARLK